MALDVLIGRIVDGEASESQRQRFEMMAASDPLLWRSLALRQQDTAMLAVHVEPTLNAADRVDLPMHAFEHENQIVGTIGGDEQPAHALPARPSWWLAASGWAAVIGLAAVWGSGAFVGRGEHVGSTGLAADQRTAPLSPEAHLKEYMHAPFVLGDMPPTLLQVEPLNDGRFAVSYLRRIVEVKYFDSPEQIPLDADGNLSATPHELVQATGRTPSQPQH